MTLQQLRILREIARQAHNLSSAAAALHTSQPGVSRQIQLLERELGVELLVRSKNRVTGMTEPGRAVLAAAQRALGEADNIRLIAAEYGREEGGRLTIATSHLHARYTLLTPIKTFALRHPGVRLHMRQADPDEILRLVASGEADIGVSTEVSAERADLLLLPGRVVERSLIMPLGHMLARKEKVTLADIAKYPLVGYDPKQRGGQIISGTFRAKGHELKLVVSAIDSDIIKAYVAEGVGIAVIPTLALDAELDRGLRVVDVTRLFPKSVMTISLRRDIYLRRYVP
ncbi:MAG TPA: LysR substrate-binding domain-containing protein, partial [Burkholderiales bacterium]|nr:LysR substrate-binding domain-containing protein [Burkholderiales bacterium]